MSATTLRGADIAVFGAAALVALGATPAAAGEPGVCEWVEPLDGTERRERWDVEIRDGRPFAQYRVHRRTGGSWVHVRSEYVEVSPQRDTHRDALQADRRRHPALG